MASSISFLVAFPASISSLLRLFLSMLKRFNCSSLSCSISFMPFWISSSSKINSVAGKILISFNFSIERWLSTSKYLMESISSSQSSILTGTSCVYGKISIIPPLTLNCPLPSTNGILSYPIATNFFFNLSKSIMSSVLNSNVLSMYFSIGIRVSDKASIVVTIINLSLLIILSITLILSPCI